jgi:RHS repeat-associated protein
MSMFPRQFGRQMSSFARCLIVSCLVAAEPVCALDSFQEQHQLIRANDAIGALGDDAFGEQVNLATGSLSFSATDVSVAGNDNLPFRIGRRFVVEGSGAYGAGASRFGGLFGDWDIDLPVIHGVFAKGTMTEKIGFVASGNSTERLLRCSRFSEPPVATGLPRTALVTFDGSEYWHGTSIYVPGVGDQEIMLRSVVNSVAPGNDVLSWPLVTRDHWQIGCLPNLANSTVEPGQGFLVRSPEGVTYYFDWLVYRDVESLFKDENPVIGHQNDPPCEDEGTQRLPCNPYAATLDRVQALMYPTRIEDRFGNAVVLGWSGDKLTSMTAFASGGVPDGRQIALEYTGAVVTAVRSGPRTWNYGYVNGALTSVTLPDQFQSQWIYSLSSLQKKIDYIPGSSCEEPPAFNAQSETYGTIKHPSGATAQFWIKPTRHGRSWIIKDCETVGTTSHAIAASRFDTLSLVRKQITGPGIIAPMTWQMSYGSTNYCWTGPEATPPICNAASSPDYRLVTVFGPERPVTAGAPSTARTVTSLKFSNRVGPLEGKLLTESIGQSVDLGPTQLLKSRDVVYASPAGKNFPDPVGVSISPGGDSEFSTRIQPVETATSQIAGKVYSGAVLNWDRFGNPTVSVKSSGTMTKRETITYSNDTTSWVLGQVDTITDTTTGTAIVELDIDYNSSALPITRKVFGRLDQTMTYCTLPLVSGCNAAGLLRTVKDGGNKTTTFGNHKRGIPQTVSFADMQSISGVVNDYGWVTAYTDELGYTTNYQYDPMGRLSKIIHPTGDSTAWNTTDIAFAPVGTSEFGVGAGHWKQSITTGRLRKDIVFDALWRPVVTSEWDTNAPAETRQVARQFDADGREVFTSYPTTGLGAFNASSLPGIAKQFDALGRLERTIASSELGPQTTSITYHSSTNSKSITNPLQQVTTIQYLQYDSPSEDWPIKITAPEAVDVTIDRDQWGKPKSIVRSRHDGGESATRSFYYDANQRLCKTKEPERGAEIFHYDSANRIDWSAAGDGISTAAICDDLSVPSSLRTLRTYDYRDRLTGVNYPGTSTYDETRTYYVDGALQTAVLGAGQPNEVKWEYQYNKRRLQTEARIYIGGETSAMNWTYNTRGQVSSVRQLNGFMLDYSPNAWGQPTQVYSPTRVLTYANGISYYPNGALKQFSYGNGAVHQMTPNTRQMPARSWDVKGDTTIVDNSYTYDGNGNPKVIDDALNIDDKTLNYDGLDRLRSATGSFGSATMTYDALDNLTRYQVGSRDWTYTIDSATQRVTSVRDTASNAVQVSYQFDRTLYEPYGTPLTTPRDGAPSYTGHQYDTGTGLIYAQQRYYDPQLGVFYSPDPMAVDTTSAFNFNRYAYANNSPYKFTDPDGRLHSRKKRALCQSGRSGKESGNGTTSG